MVVVSRPEDVVDKDRKAGTKDPLTLAVYLPFLISTVITTPHLHLSIPRQVNSKAL